MAKQTKNLPAKKEDSNLPTSFASWYEVEPSFPDSWTPENAGDYIVGKLDTIKNGVGPNSQKVYVMKDVTIGNAITKKEEKVQGMLSVWDSTILNVRLAPFQVGDDVAIMYLGKELNPKTGRTFKNMKVYRSQPLS